MCYDWSKQKKTRVGGEKNYENAARGETGNVLQCADTGMNLLPSNLNLISNLPQLYQTFKTILISKKSELFPTSSIKEQSYHLSSSLSW